MSRTTSKIFLPNFDLEEMLKAALWNVDYHLAAVRHFRQADVRRFHAHLRAFFWELVASFEAMKLWAIESHGRNSPQITLLEQESKADWYVEVANYRNFAHRCFLVTEGICGTQDQKLKGIMLINAGVNSPQRAVPEGLDEYRNEMHKLFDRLKQL